MPTETSGPDRAVPHQALHQAEGGTGHEDKAGNEQRLRPVVSACGLDERQDDEADGALTRRSLPGEPPPPAPTTGPGDQGEAGDAGKDAERLAALAREGCAQQRHAERHHERGADTFYGTGDDQSGMPAGHAQAAEPR